ncbi:acyl-CoA dehydrogenase family protein [Candidatus Poriferisodalis sp.]|uniref:acyl-CoA dehydrogenase family protein n=1 Tax=Candidatus Poriferisodalis sp. TaxID=3101277 RepID=UPI003B52AB27
MTAADADTAGPDASHPEPGNFDDPASGMDAASFEGFVGEVTQFRDTVVAPNVSRWEGEKRMAPEALREASGLGLLAMEVPTALGGLGMSFAQKCRIVEVLSAISMPFAFSLVNTGNVAARVAQLGNDAHRDRYLADLMAGRRFGSTALTEPGAGSDFANIATTATPVDGGWRLDGAKAWITNAAHSDVIFCYTQTEPGSRGRGIASFLVDGTRPGFERLPPYELAGGHLIGTGGFRLDGYIAEADDLIGPPGQAFIAAMSGVNGARTYVAAMCCAMVEATLAGAVRFGTEREAFGKPILGHQGLAWKLAGVQNRLEAAQLLTGRAVDAVTESLRTGDASGAILPAAHAKKFATETAEADIAACIQAMGAEGLRSTYPWGHHLVGARIANYVDGSTEIQTDRIARSLAATYAQD